MADTQTIIAAGAPEAAWVLIAALVAAGHAVVLADSDGTTYDNNGGAVTGYGSGAGGLANAGAWIYFRNADSTIYWVYQTGSTTLTDARIKVSCDAFSGSPGGGGSTDATHVPSSTTELVRLGAGTDASPTYAAFVLGAAFEWCTYVDATTGAFYGAGKAAGGVVRTGWICDKLSPSVTSDARPWVNLVAYTTSTTVSVVALGYNGGATSTSAPATAQWAYRADHGGLDGTTAAWRTMEQVGLYDSAQAIGLLGTGASWNLGADRKGKEWFMPLLYARSYHATPNNHGGPIGQSSLFSLAVNHNSREIFAVVGTGSTRYLRLSPALYGAWGSTAVTT